MQVVPVSWETHRFKNSKFSEEDNFWGRILGLSQILINLFLWEYF